MAKAATPLFPAPSFKFPEPKLPKLDLDALFATQKANLAAVQEAQSVLIDAAQAIAKVQHDYLGQSMAAVRVGRDQGRGRADQCDHQAGHGLRRGRCGGTASGGRAGHPAHPGQRQRVEGARRLTGGSSPTECSRASLEAPVLR